MALAYLILAHKNARQVARLFETLYRPQDTIVLHFDRRAGRELHELGATWARQYQNVHVLRPRTILWGGYEMAAVQIEAAATALRASAQWTHFINLTGQDFPIKPLAQLEAKLQATPEASYVSWFDPVFKPLWKNARDRLSFYYLEWPWLDRLLRVPGLGRRLRRLLGWESRLPHLPGYRREWPDFRYFGGANHVILSRAAATYLARDPEARRIIRWLKHSAHANEIIFQTVLLNSPQAPRIINTHLREVDFAPNSPHPRTFTIKDFERLTASPMYFARKFDEQVDRQILEWLQARVRAAASEVGAPAHR
jgi:hypothetical protein